MNVSSRVVNMKRIKRITAIILLVFTVFISLSPKASAVGLIENHEQNGYEYTKYPDDRYELDLYVEDSGFLGTGEWFPGIMNGLSNAFWSMSRWLSSLTGGIVREAYSLELVSSLAEYTGENIQTLAGVNSSGLESDGLYANMLKVLVVILGVYLMYVGLLKRQTSKAVSSLLSFIMVFMLLFSFLVYSPQYLEKFTTFSSDLNKGMLSVGTNLSFSDNDVQSDDPVDSLVNSLWNTQVKQPWLILQYGTTNIDEARTDEILSLRKNSEARKEVAEKEVLDLQNDSMASSNVGTRFGMVLLLFIVNLIISIFVILLCFSMLLSELLFLIFVMLLPIVGIISLLPNQFQRLQKAVVQVFSLLCTKAVISLIMTIGFGISAMFYSIAESTSFLIIALLQVLIFAGVFLNLPRILNSLGLDGGALATTGLGVAVMGRMGYRGAKGAGRAVRRTRKGIARAGKSIIGAFRSIPRNRGQSHSQRAPSGYNSVSAYSYAPRKKPKELPQPKEQPKQIPAKANSQVEKELSALPTKQQNSSNGKRQLGSKTSTKPVTEKQRKNQRTLSQRPSVLYDRTQNAQGSKVSSPASPVTETKHNKKLSSIPKLGNNEHSNTRFSRQKAVPIDRKVSKMTEDGIKRSTKVDSSLEVPVKKSAPSKQQSYLEKNTEVKDGKVSFFGIEKTSSNPAQPAKLKDASFAPTTEKKLTERQQKRAKANADRLNKKSKNSFAENEYKSENQGQNNIPKDKNVRRNKPTKNRQNRNKGDK